MHSPIHMECLSMFILVTPTHYRNEKYCDLLVELVKHMWPHHPEIWFLTDTRGGQGIRYANKIKIESDQWVAVLIAGLKRLKDKYPGLEYIYLVLEDLYPLWRCSDSDLIEIQKVAVKNQMGCVFFTTFDFNWDLRVEVDGRSFYKIPADFPFYSQLQPAI